MALHNITEQIAELMNDTQAALTVPTQRFFHDYNSSVLKPYLFYTWCVLQQPEQGGTEQAAAPEEPAPEPEKAE